MLKGRLGLETARIPQGDRHGCLWLQRGNLYVESGTLRFRTKGGGDLESGDYAIPFQTISNILIGPGSTVSHDCLRLLARQGTGLIVTGEDGVRFYASMPFGTDESAIARKQVQAWTDRESRLATARRMYAWRLGELLPSSDLAVLRGIEGARVKALYRTLAQQYGISWAGRRYDRDDPEAADLVNQALNHSTTALRSAAMIAVAATAAIPQLGFVHEDSAISFCLDIADVFREQVALPAAFHAVKEKERRPEVAMERIARQQAGKILRDRKIIAEMIDRIKSLFGA